MPIGFTAEHTELAASVSGLVARHALSRTQVAGRRRATGMECRDHSTVNEKIDASNERRIGPE